MIHAGTGLQSSCSPVNGMKSICCHFAAKHDSSLVDVAYIDYQNINVRTGSVGLDKVK